MKCKQKTLFVLVIALFFSGFVSGASEQNNSPKNDIERIRELFPPKGELRAVKALSHFDVITSGFPKKVVKRVEASEIVGDPLNTTILDGGFNFWRGFKNKYEALYPEDDKVDSYQFIEVDVIRVIDSNGNTVRDFELPYKEDIVPLRNDNKAKNWAMDIFKRREENKYQLRRNFSTDGVISNNGKYFSITKCNDNWLKASGEEESELPDYSECETEVFKLNGGRIQTIIKKKSIGWTGIRLIFDNGTVLFNMGEPAADEKGYFIGEEKKPESYYILFDHIGREFYRSVEGEYEESSKSGKIIEFVEPDGKIVFIDTENRRKSEFLFDMEHIEKSYDKFKFDEKNDWMMLKKENEEHLYPIPASNFILVELFVPPCTSELDGLKKCGIVIHVRNGPDEPPVVPQKAIP